MLPAAQKLQRRSLSFWLPAFKGLAGSPHLPHLYTENNLSTSCFYLRYRVMEAQEMQVCPRRNLLRFEPKKPKVSCCKRTHLQPRCGFGRLQLPGLEVADPERRNAALCPKGALGRGLVAYRAMGVEWDWPTPLFNL